MASLLPVWLPNASGDRLYPGGGTWVCLGVPGAQCIAACGLNSALLFRKPRLAPAKKVICYDGRHIHPIADADSGERFRLLSTMSNSGSAAPTARVAALAMHNMQKSVQICTAWAAPSAM